MEEFVKNFHSFNSTGDLVLNDEDEEVINFETLENSNENDESEINEKEEKTVTLNNPITNETNKVPVVVIDVKSNKKVKKWLLSNITGENFHQGKVTKIFQVTNNFSRQKFSSTKFSPIWHQKN